MERLKTMFTRILWYKFLFVKVIQFGGRRESIFNLNNVWHHSRGFEDSNISKSLENFILVMFYALTSPYFYNMYLFSRIGHLKKIILKGRGFRCGSDEKMMRMWFWLEIDVVGLRPSSPHPLVLLTSQNR